jgi:capsular exopolysaccharide synthesis family protein
VVGASTPAAANLDNQILVLQQSERIGRQTARRLLAMQADDTSAAPMPVLAFDEEPTAPQGPAFIENVARRLQGERIQVYRDNDEADAVWVAATSTEPREAALLANVYAEEYVARTVETGRQRISGSRQFLQAQVDRHHEKLRDLEDQIKQLARQGAVALDTETERTIGQIADLEAQLDAARVEERMHRASLASIEQELADLQPRLVRRLAADSEEEIELVQTKLARLELLAQQARANGAANGAADATAVDDLNQLQMSIQNLEAHLAGLSTRYVEELMRTRGVDPQSDGRDYIAQLHRQRIQARIELSGVDAREAALRERLRGYEQKLASIPEQSMELAQVRRAHRSTEQLYDRLTEQLQAVRIAEESEIGTAQVLRSAVAPETPQGGNGRTILILGGVLGLLLGVVVAVVRDKLDVRIHTPDDLEERAVPLIGVIPDLDAFATARYDGAEKTTVDGQAVSTALPVLLAPQSADAEAFRQLYVNLQFSRADTVIQTIVVTSAEKGAGKSTTAVNLALAAAQTGRRTLLIDADLRRPTLHALLGITGRGGPGLEEALRQPAETAAAAAPTGADNLWALTTDTPSAGAGPLLRSPRMRAWLNALRADFDAIVVDTPPVFVASESVMIATQSDATVVVARAGSTAGDALDQTLDRLESLGAPVAGVVLNRFDPTYVYGYGATLKYSNRGYEYSPA